MNPEQPVDPGLAIGAPRVKREVRANLYKGPMLYDPSQVLNKVCPHVC